jgi:hypothetical protein
VVSLPPVPSSLFSIEGLKVGKGARLVFGVRVLGAGAFTAVAKTKVTTGKTAAHTARKPKRRVKTITYGKVAASVAAAGMPIVTIKPTRTALAALKRAKRLPVAVTVTFTATGGLPRTQHRSITVRTPKSKRRQK